MDRQRGRRHRTIARMICRSGSAQRRREALTIISDHVSLPGMERMPVSKFKATCLAVLQRVKRTRRPVLITRFGEPVAEVVPPRPRASRSDWLGAMAGRAEIIGDIVGPVTVEKDWATGSR
jgi:prevent-host-death family protein